PPVGVNVTDTVTFTREWRCNARLVAALGFSVNVNAPFAFFVSVARAKPLAEATKRPAPGAPSLSFTRPVRLAEWEAIVNTFDGIGARLGRTAGGGPATLSVEASQGVGPTGALRSSPP